MCVCVCCYGCCCCVCVLFVVNVIVDGVVGLIVVDVDVGVDVVDDGVVVSGVGGRLSVTLSSNIVVEFGGTTLAFAGRGGGRGRPAAYIL